MNSSCMTRCNHVHVFQETEFPNHSSEQMPASTSALSKQISVTVHLSDAFMCAAPRIANMHPSALAALLRDPASTADALVAMRKALPKSNISAIVSANPAVLELAANGVLEKVRVLYIGVP